MNFSPLNQWDPSSGLLSKDVPIDKRDQSMQQVIRSIEEEAMQYHKAKLQKGAK